MNISQEASDVRVEAVGGATERWHVSQLLRASEQKPHDTFHGFLDLLGACHTTSQISSILAVRIRILLSKSTGQN